MKKTLSMLLAFVMVFTLALTVMPMSAFAASGTYVGDEAAKTAGMYFRIGELDAENGNVYAPTFKDAMTAAKAAGDGVTVYMISDFTTNESLTTSGADGFKNLTINGGGYSFTHTNTAYSADFGGFTSLCFENFKAINLVRAIRTSSSINNLTFKDIESLNSYDRPAIWLGNASETVKLTLDNTNVMTLAKTAGQTTLRLGKDSGGSATLTLEMKNGSSITQNGSATSNSHNSSALGITTLTSATVIVDGTSKIEVANSTGTGAAFAIRVHNDVKPDITLKNGSQLVVSGTSTAAGFMGGYSASITDEGCEYIVKASAANGAISFPEVIGKKYVSGNTSILSGTKYNKTSAQTTDMVFKMLDAAAITTDAEAVANGMFFRVGAVSDHTYVATLAAALAAASEGDTIYLLSDGYTLSSETLFAIKDLTIDGQGFKMGLTAGYGINVRATGFKLHNITIDTNVQIMSVNPVGAGAEFLVTLDNVTLKTTKGIIVNYNHNRNSAGMAGLDTLCKLVISDSTLVGDTTAFEDVILLNNNTNFDVDIKNSTLKVANSKDATTWGRVLVVSGSTTGKVDINVENSTLESAYNKKSQLIAVLKDTDVNITFDNKTKLILSAAASTDTYAEFVYGKSKTVVNDNGATYTASASVIKAATDGVALPTYAPEGKTVIGYMSDNALYTAKYIDADATDEKSFKAVAFDKDDFVMETGASIRTAAPYGIRFTAYVSDALLSLLGEKMEFGMIITPYANAYNQEAFVNIEELSSNKYAKIVGDNLKDATVDGVAVKKLIAAVYMQNDENLTTAGKTQFETKMAACSYIKVTYADGATVTFWTDYSGSNNARSLYDVAKAYYEDTKITDGSNKNNETINNILTVCGYTFGA